MRMKSLKFLVMVFLCAICLMPFPSHGETGAVIIAADTSVTVGDNMTVTVKYTGTSLGLIDGELRYDPDMLKYVSGGTSTVSGSNIIKLKKDGAGSTSQLFTLRFVAVGEGSDFFLVNTFQLKDGTGNDLGKPGASVKLIVAEPTPQPVVEAPDVTVEEPIVDPVAETPATEEEAVTDAEIKTAPDTLWVFVGAIAVTTLLLAISLFIVIRKKKTVK